MSAVPAGDAPAEPGAEGRARRARAGAPCAARARAHVQRAHAAAGQRLAAVWTGRDLLEVIEKGIAIIL